MESLVTTSDMFDFDNLEAFAKKASTGTSIQESLLPNAFKDYNRICSKFAFGVCKLRNCFYKHDKYVKRAWSFCKGFQEKYPFKRIPMDQVSALLE